MNICQGILKLTQGKISENTGNLVFIEPWELCTCITVYVTLVFFTGFQNCFETDEMGSYTEVAIWDF